MRYIFLILVLSACSTPPKPLPIPAPVADAGPPRPATVCDLACSNLARLRCPEALPVGGFSCSQVCQDVEDTNYVTVVPGAVAACGDVLCLRRWGVDCRWEN